MHLRVPNIWIAFSFFGGHYEYNNMPYGLFNSALRILSNTCILYIDNVIVRTEEQTKAERAFDCETKETHDTKVEKVGR